MEDSLSDRPDFLLSTQPQINDAEFGLPLNVEAPENYGPERRMMDATCWKRCCGFYCCYCIVICALIFPTILLGAVGLVIFALVPAIVIMGFAEQWYGPTITRCSMVDVFLEAFVLISIPLTIAIIFIDAALPMKESCTQEFDDGEEEPPAWRYAFQAYIRAGMLEELVKYFAIRRLLHKPYVVDARSLMVYGAISGTAFGVVENIDYALMAGISTAVVRSFLTVPLHASTGLMIGASLVPYRFRPPLAALGAGGKDAGDSGGDISSSSGGAFGGASVDISPPPRMERQASQLGPPGGACTSWAWWREQIVTMYEATWAPILLHGSYDVMIFVAAGECGAWNWLYVPVYLGVICQGFFIRWRVFGVERRFPPDSKHNVHDKIKSGEIPKPCILGKCCCGSCTCCECCECCY